MNKPNFGQTITTRITCDLLRPLKGKPMRQVAEGLHAYMIGKGADPEVEPTLTYDTYEGWAMIALRKLSAEQKQQLRQWEEEQASLKIAKARLKIQQLAEQAGVSVEFAE